MVRIKNYFGQLMHRGRMASNLNPDVGVPAAHFDGRGIAIGRDCWSYWAQWDCMNEDLAAAGRLPWPSGSCPDRLFRKREMLSGIAHDQLQLGSPREGANSVPAALKIPPGGRYMISSNAARARCSGCCNFAALAWVCIDWKL